MDIHIAMGIVQKRDTGFRHDFKIRCLKVLFMIAKGQADRYRAA